MSTWQERNPEVFKQYQKDWYAANRERIAEQRKARRADGRYKVQAREWWLRYSYGMTIDEYRDHLIGQAGRCLICLRVPTQDLVVDHRHSDGIMRGLLCQSCNRGIGFLRDDPEVARSAARYLETGS
jgi:hypothetical protein